VRLILAKRSDIHFFWWYCEGFLSEEKMDMAFRLDFLFLFDQAKRKMKTIIFKNA
jgi:hypothetical protein